MKDYDLRPQLNQLHMPILILSGKYDVQCPHEFSEEMSDLLPGARFVPFLDSNHFPYIEQKAGFINSVDDFFKEL
ncbi:alpha/beta fold hydrolase [Paenibacillus sp. HW567]|uniref:alpha/beta fold hydrolase n=1 Tax=Paenibacillus sp. HW567 TaxID=1034769 RepID=UPI000365C30A|nr:alpha/beta hydrolase [Paenibacillus sp. HW567]